MRTTLLPLAAGLLVVSAGSALAAVHYVDVNSTGSTWPYTGWATAATNIQDAVDAAVSGDEIVVTNGIYATGRRATVGDSTTNRVEVDKPLSLRSANGPQSTIIDGGQSVRCVYLTNGANLSGFTLTNGVAWEGAGLWCQSTNVSVSNCVVVGNSAYGDIDDEAFGAGAVGGTLNSCILTNNRASGGAYGGGASGATLNNCTLSGNSADSAGGAGGCTLNNCAITANFARKSGGGVSGCILNNCTLTGNSGGGASSSTLNNCIAYFNTAQNYDSCTLNYCCTTPQPTSGVGNISLDPQLASASHLSSVSPCRAAGSAAYASGTDVDGELWASPPSIGCDEYHAAALTGLLNVGITASFTTVTMGFTVQLTALIDGRTAASSWDFGDDIAAANQPYASHAWTALGDYAVVLRAFNESQPGGISATVTVHVVTQPVHYVAAGSGNPVAPYMSWATAASNIQDAVDAATVPGSLVLVTNGTYATGGRTMYGTANRVVIDKLLTVRSVNGPEFTAIHGAKDGSGIRCVDLTNSATLSGFTLTNGGGYYYYAAVFCESQTAVVSNCVVTGNSMIGASGGTLNNCILTGNLGAGAVSSMLSNCTLTGNSSGADGCTLNNCTVTGNSYGGAANCTLNNCIVYFNDVGNGQNYDSNSSLSYCCTTPQPAKGAGNISSDPQLANFSHLSAGSPCRGAGTSDYATGTDIDGEPWASPPSIGCDEYHAGALTGPLSVAIAASFTSVPIGFTVQLTALIEGRNAASSWDFGDSTVATNQPYTSHAWTAVGDYAVVLRAFNESQLGGISATVTVHVVSQPVHYVAATSANPVAPYTSWATAATNIQDAVDAATVPGALLLVTNGNYGAGGRDGNRVAVEKPLSLRSVNGPQSTTIDGGQSGRCVYLTNGASLSGFTLTGGSAYHGGGLWCESRNAVVSNCVVSGNYTFAVFCGFDCYVQPAFAGGVDGGTLNDCILSDNRAEGYYDRVFHYQYRPGSGGGARSATLNRCTLTGNSADYGGGAYGCTLNNCILTGNSSGAGFSTLNNCILTGNSSGADGCTLNNCTVTGNSYGGAANCTLNNCIVYFNTAEEGVNYDSSSTLNYCCTTPQPTSGVGNISLDPQLASSSHMSAGSPCRAAGSAAYASGTDIDGELWASPPSIGCDEYHAAALTGPLSVGITASFTTVTMGFTVQLTALIEGRIAASSWDFGDGTAATNQPFTSHAWTAPGDYAVVFHAYNESQPGGTSATVTVNVVKDIHYVATDSRNPVAPYMSWATAATNIQDAVDAATVPGGVVLVTNGMYATGGRVMGGATNRVVIDKFLTVRSVNGPEVTTIDGGQSVSCAHLTTFGTLSGFTLTNGGGYRAGVFCESQTAVVSNCVVTGNSMIGASGGTLNNCILTGNSGGGASSCTLNNCTLTTNRVDGNLQTYPPGGFGGGAYACKLNNCVLSGNSAGAGGGAYSSTLNNCTLRGNSAYYGGGSFGCTLNNCTITDNSVSGSHVRYFDRQCGCIIEVSPAGGGAYSSTLNNCILFKNINDGICEDCSSDPLFANQAAGDLRLQSNSPCINAGLNVLAPAGPDLDGNPRIAGGTVDMGAYEFQSPASIISYAWLQQFNLPINPATDAADPDGDGVNNYREWLDGTDPTNPVSFPPLLTLIPNGVPPSGIILTWPTNAVGFTLQSTTNLGSAELWTTNSPAPVVIGGQNTVTNPISGPQQFYRLRRITQ